MEKIQCAFVTGGTGLLGINIVKELIQNTSAKIFLLIRNPSLSKKDKFFKDLLSFSSGLWPVGFSFKRIKFIEGDVSLPDLGIAPRTISRLTRDIDYIYHSAAVIKLEGSEKEIYAANIVGTRNVMDFAIKCKEKGRLHKVVHVSTVSVAGNFEGTFYENDLDVGQGFNNPYEWSKFEAEKIVEDYRHKGINILIVRPSMIIGDSKTGFTNHYNIFYYQLRFISQGLIDVIPLHENAAYNLVPADCAAKAIRLVSHDADSYNKNYHIVNLHNNNVRDFMEKACSYLGCRTPRLVSADTLSHTSYSGGMQGKVLNIYLPYLSVLKSFDAANASAALEPHGFSWPRIEGSLLGGILDYCVLSGYLSLESRVRHEAGAYNV